MRQNILPHACVARLLALARLLRQNRPFTAPLLADQLGSCDRTLKRDIRLLRDLGWRIEWDPREATYTLMRAPRPVL